MAPTDSSATEETISDLMAQYLDANGVDFRREVSIKEVEEKGRSQPDFYNDEEAVVGEAKWEEKYWEGLGEAHDYLQISGIDEAFAIAYPESLKEEAAQARVGDGEEKAEAILEGYNYSCAYLREDYPTDTETLDLEAIPEWLQEHINEDPDSEHDPEEIVSILRQLAHRLNNELKAAPEDNLFRNVLGQEPEEEEMKKASRRTAGVILVNQITFYHALASERGFPEIDTDEIEVPVDLREKYFDKVLEEDYTTVFGFNIVDGLPAESIDLLKQAVKSIDALGPENIHHDVLGKIFHEVLPFTARKDLAAFYTKNKSSDILSELAIENADDKILEPSCGSGTLLTSGYQKKRELTDEFDGKDHRRFIEEEITGLDVMPFAGHLSCIHLALQAPLYDTDQTNIGIMDSTKLEPGDTIEPLDFVLPSAGGQRELTDYTGEQEEVESGSVGPDQTGQEMELEKVDVVMMNPPFTKGNSIAGFGPSYKEDLKQRFSDREEYIHGSMSYCSYFLLLADKFLDEGGKIAAVLPATVLTKKSDRKVRRMLLEKYQMEYIITRGDEANFSEDTDFREVLIVAEKGTEPDGDTAFVQVDSLDVSPEEIDSLSDEISLGESREEDDIYVQKTETAKLNQNNLLGPIAVHSPQLFSIWDEMPMGKLVSLGEFDGGRIGGVRGGGNDARSYNPEMTLNSSSAGEFLKDEDVWVVEEETTDSITARHRYSKDEFNIPKSHTVPNLRRFSGRQQMDVTELDEYAVVKQFDGYERFEGLTSEENIPVSDWKKKAEDRLAHVALVRRANITAPNTHHMAYYSGEKRLGPNIMWMLTNVPREDAKVVASWFDSTLGWLQFLINRVETEGGFGSWRGYVVDEFYALNPEKLTADDREVLDEAFAEFSKVEVPSLVEQIVRATPEECVTDAEQEALEVAYPEISSELGTGFEARRQIDRTILDVLGVSEDSDDLLNDLYAAILREFIALKRMTQ